ncbi:interferon-inducible GTPase 5-like protein [Labeo rohita]|uniref:Interferon-inducible GTPase 5-like protein n=1 Tax=Labeo rohita TaxID=84645 RepID=A0A498P4B0_LABRO|nr:interferon-inducible GTPase 5-like protein [Labeo rohita]
MFGRILRLPVDLVFETVLDNPDVVNYDSYIQALRRDMKEAMHVAQASALKQLKRHADLYNRKVFHYSSWNQEIQNMENQDPAVVDALKASGESTLEKATAKAKMKMDQFFNVPLNVAVTGNTGSGKSSFVNALRGLKDDDVGAAPTGVTETTMAPVMYEHPEMPNVKIWDLPGIGSPNFKAKKYLKDVKFNTYDFFIILSSVRFMENDIMLAKEIRKQKKGFYFVCSKIDNDISSEKKKKGFDEQKVLSIIREDCQKNLKELGDPKVFLISSHDLEEYDFESLQNILEDELPEHKKYALLQAWPVCSAASLEKKISMFKWMIWAASLASAGIAVIPVPGLSAACDLGIVVLFLTRCYYAFGLDERSLTRLSEKVNKPHLKDLAKSKFVTAIRERALTRLQVSTALATIATVEYFLSLLPGVGSVAAAGISFATTRYLLTEGVNDLANTARVIRKEAGLASVH